MHTPSLPLLGLVFVGSSQHSLASRCIIPTSASVVIWPSFLTYLHIIFLLFLITLCSCQPLGQNTILCPNSEFPIEFSVFHYLQFFDFNRHLDHLASASYLTISPSIYIYFFPSTPPQPPSPLTLVLITALSPKALFQTCHSNPHSLYSSTFPELFDLIEIANPLSTTPHPRVFSLPIFPFYSDFPQNRFHDPPS